MWAVEGLTHRYPTKVLAELLATCPQYCGHCTRMDLVGNDVPQVEKTRFHVGPQERYGQILEYLRKTPSVRDVVVSGGDIANLPIALYYGMRIGQISFFRMSSPVDRPYGSAELGSKYQGQSEPTASAFHRDFAQAQVGLGGTGNDQMQRPTFG